MEKIIKKEKKAKSSESDVNVVLAAFAKGDFSKKNFCCR